MTGKDKTMALTGYGRVSTRDQNPDSQRDALLEAGVPPDRIYIDHGRSGKLASRPELDRCLASLVEGDTLVITRLSRAARSLRNLLALTEDLHARGVGLKVLKQDIDTSTPTGRLVFHILAAIDEFQREIIVENTEEGVKAAAARGRKGGRPAGLDPRRVKTARQLYDGGETVSEIAKVMRVSRATVYRHLEASKPST
jgi:DNA invertase Pin-like site-specific DNA recombinase